MATSNRRIFVGLGERYESTPAYVGIRIRIEVCACNRHYDAPGNRNFEATKTFPTHAGNDDVVGAHYLDERHNGVRPKSHRCLADVGAGYENPDYGGCGRLYLA